jgi:hypothetical protein
MIKISILLASSFVWVFIFSAIIPYFLEVIGNKLTIYVSGAIALALFLWLSFSQSFVMGDLNFEPCWFDLIYPAITHLFFYAAMLPFLIKGIKKNRFRI